MAAIAPSRTIEAPTASPAAAIFKLRGVTAHARLAISDVLIRPRLNSDSTTANASTSHRAGMN